MNSSVIPFPTGRRVTSEESGIGGVLYYRLERMARRIHFLLEVAKQQASPTPGKTYKWIRKRTVKRCFLAISESGASLEQRIQELQIGDNYTTAFLIYLDLLEKKKGIDKETIEHLKRKILHTGDQTIKEQIINLLTGFHLRYEQIIGVLSGHINYKISGLEDDVYTFIRQVSRFPIGDY